MDADFDFVRPEFLNALFFQQKSLVIFPHVDLKQLHSLELFAIGHNIVDLESTAVSNLKDVVEFEVNNGYSRVPTLYIIYNASLKEIREIIKMKNVYCVVNTHENARSVALELESSSNFVFYNKKTDQFYNYDIKDNDLEFERQLVESSDSLVILQDKIQRIKSAATMIFASISQNESNLDVISEILKDYDRKYWDKILNFVRLYFCVNVPRVNELKLVSKNMRQDKDFSSEYSLIANLNKSVVKEFVRLLREFRFQKINPSNLDLEQLYSPQKLYNYLRNRHWSAGIPEQFICKWYQVVVQRKDLLGNIDISEFEKTLEKLGASKDLMLKYSIEDRSSEEKERGARSTKESKKIISPSIISTNANNIAAFPNNLNDNIIQEINIPSINNFKEFKTWLVKRLDQIEQMLNAK